MRNKTSFLLALIGGILLISSAASGSIGFFAVLDLIPIPDLIPIINVIIYVLTILAGLGGISVIVGGYLLTTNRFGTGKFVIGLGAGMGLIGLIVSVLSLILPSVMALLNLPVVVSQGAGWAGAVLTIVARMLAKKPE